MKVGGDITKIAVLDLRYSKTCHVSYIKQCTYTEKLHVVKDQFL